MKIICKGMGTRVIDHPGPIEAKEIKEIASKEIGTLFYVKNEQGQYLLPEDFPYDGNIVIVGIINW